MGSFVSTHAPLIGQFFELWALRQEEVLLFSVPPKEALLCSARNREKRVAWEKEGSREREGGDASRRLRWQAGRMDAIVVRALNKIATDCPRRQSTLKTECLETVGK